MPKHHSANAPRLAHVFWPLSTQPSPAASRDARERMPARSLPASGSDQPWHQISSPDALGQGGGEEEDAVRADARGRRGGGVLLFEDEPFEDAEVAPAVLVRPAHDGP